MLSIWVAFLTGLTTGGLSCMAVQGGLLASSLANQIEKDTLANSKRKKTGKNWNIALPITLFLAAKLTVYTLVGFLLGALGSLFQLTSTLRAIIQFAIAIFMIGNALRMLNVHPLFRFFTFEPPTSVTRFIRKKTKNPTSPAAPLFLGALTVLIPCGVTQTMMAGAIATGDALQGAVLMFAFTLGTSPLFFILSFLATKLGTLLEKQLVRVTAVVLLVLGLLSVDTGLNLLGSPVSLTRVLQQENNKAGLVHTNNNDPSVLNLNVEDKGYSPKTLYAPADTEITLNLITEDTHSCSRAFIIPELEMSKLLPETGIESLLLPPQAAGKILGYSCSMGMYTGEIIFQ